MSKRYPPIFNVILFIVAVCIILANPMTMLMPWISTVTSFVVFAVSTTLDIQINRLPDNEYDEDGIIYNKVMMILRDLEELSNGRATSRSYSYD